MRANAIITMQLTNEHTISLCDGDVAVHVWVIADLEGKVITFIINLYFAARSTADSQLHTNKISNHISSVGGLIEFELFGIDTSLLIRKDLTMRIINT